MTRGPLCLAYFTQQVFKVHPRCDMNRHIIGFTAELHSLVWMHRILFIVRQFLGIWLVPTVRLLLIMLLWTLMDTFLCGQRFSILLGIYLGVLCRSNVNFYPHPKAFLSLLLERGTKREKHRCQREASVGCLPYSHEPGIAHTGTGDWTHNPDTCPDQNWTHNLLAMGWHSDWATLARASLQHLRFLPAMYADPNSSTSLFSL